MRKKKSAKASGQKKKRKPSKRAGASKASIRIKRAYDAPESGDGLRILIDRLWPRGIAKSKLKLDAWVKHLSPSNELRKWYQHDPEKFAEFRRRYVAELKVQSEGLAELRAAVKGRTVTLLTATSISTSYGRFMPEPVGDVYVSGGGAKNPTLMREIDALLPTFTVRPFADRYFDGEAKEAVAFALLAHLHVHAQPGNVPRATGARGPRILGKLTPA